MTAHEALTKAAEGWQPTVSELEWLLAAPAGMFKVEIKTTGETSAILTERGRWLVAADYFAANFEAV